MSNEGLIKSNITALVKDIRRQLDGWQRDCNCPVWPHSSTENVVSFIITVCIPSIDKLLETQKLCENFAWGGKKPRIKNSILQQAKEQGVGVGVGFP